MKKIISCFKIFRREKIVPFSLQPMPYANSGICGVRVTYQPCCGKTICGGCTLAEDSEIQKGNIKPWCAFCRVPMPKSEKEAVKRIKKRMKLKDANAFLMLGCKYQQGGMGLTQDFSKAIELWKHAAELGSLDARAKIAGAYFKGDVVEQDREKAIQHWKLAAIGGNEVARYALGLIEELNGNLDIAMNHYMIGAKSGSDESLKKVGHGYKNGYVTKNEYASTLRAYQCIRDEMKSEQRTQADAIMKRKTAQFQNQWDE